MTSETEALSPPDAHPLVGAVFRDLDAAPEMVVVPAGKFWMGSAPDEPERFKNEDLRHEVTIARRFAVGRYAVTFDEWDAAHAAGGVMHNPDDEGWGRGRRPVINVSWEDAKAYTAWLSKVTGKAYRLLSEAEWEYVCRAGTETPFWWGASITPKQANYNGDYTYAGGEKGEYRGKTVPVDSFEANPWGLYQVHGNVWEWCEDCWNKSYEKKPEILKQTGGAWTDGDSDCWVLRGGSWCLIPANLRSANRFGIHAGNRYFSFGFRVARTL